jgi:hypothetical protein
MNERKPSAAERLSTAKRKYAGLQAQLESTQAEIAKLEGERASLAYHAHASGNGEATVRVEQINSLLVPLRLEVETITLAIG